MVTWNISKQFRDPVTIGNTLVARITREEEKPFSVVAITDILGNTWIRAKAEPGEFVFVSNSIHYGGRDEVIVDIEGDLQVKLEIGEVSGV